MQSQNQPKQVSRSEQIGFLSGKLEGLLQIEVVALFWDALQQREQLISQDEKESLKDKIASVK